MSKLGFGVKIQHKPKVVIKTNIKLTTPNFAQCFG